MKHVAEITVKNSSVVSSNSSRDHFANGVKLSTDVHNATMWIDDMDADVSITGIATEGDIKTPSAPMVNMDQDLMFLLKDLFFNKQVSQV